MAPSRLNVGAAPQELKCNERGVKNAGYTGDSPAKLPGQAAMPLDFQELLKIAVRQAPEGFVQLRCAVAGGAVCGQLAQRLYKRTWLRTARQVFKTCIMDIVN